QGHRRSQADADGPHERWAAPAASPPPLLPTQADPRTRSHRTPSRPTLLANAVDDSEMGTASAMHQLMAQIGALLGAAVMISVHEATLNQGILPSYSNALVIGAALCVVAGLLAGEVRSTKR
ncbi:MAG: hypothetical protein ACO31F_05590, partial [Ilumatobacteraceae bacterium]